MTDRQFSATQYRALLDVAEAIAIHRDLDALFDHLAQRLPQIVPFDYINLVLYDATRHRMRLHVLAVPLPSSVGPGAEFDVDDSPGGWVWKTQQPLVVEDVSTEQRFSKLMPLMRENGIQSFCSIPLTSALRRLGAMGFGSLQPKVYGPDELEFMQQVAQQVAVAVDNVLHEQSMQAARAQLERERDRTRLLLEVNNAIVAHLDLERLFAAVSNCLRRVVQHDGASLMLIDPRSGRYRVHVLLFAKNESWVEEGLGEMACSTPTSMAIANRQPVVFDEAALRALCRESPIAQRLIDEGVKAFCSVPLISHDCALGALNIGRMHEGMFSPEEVDLLADVARQISIAVENAQAYQEISALKDQLAKEKLYLQEEIRTEHNFEEVVGESSALRRVLKQVETVAPTDSTVLIQGETGTGKELIARAVHELSPRRDRTFVKINCAAIPTGLLESELFGHEKGAFTGAIAQKIGRFELAHQGTLFLDEVGDIPAELQPKLLRVLQEQEFERLGGNRTIRVDVRLVAATHQDLGRLSTNGTFRADLYYRLNVFPLTLPPLRQRPEDIPRLVRHFAQRFARRMGRGIESIPTATMDALVGYHWPGNVRELENVIERAVILSPGPDLVVNLQELSRLQAPDTAPGPRTALSLEAAEKEHILAALREANWVLGGPNGAAARLAVKRTTLQSRMKKLGIARPH